MRFHLIDRIVSYEPGKGLRGLKRLTAGEEYLADHFPGFPIMPGVLQLQSLVEGMLVVPKKSPALGMGVVQTGETTMNFTYFLVVRLPPAGVRYPACLNDN